MITRDDDGDGDDYDDGHAEDNNGDDENDVKNSNPFQGIRSYQVPIHLTCFECCKCRRKEKG